MPTNRPFLRLSIDFISAHSQGETRDELHENLRQVVEMLLEDGELHLETELLETN